MQNERIAIVGASFSLPGGQREQFWRKLVAGEDLVTELEPWKWPKDVFLHPRKSEPGRAFTFASGVVENSTAFDPAFFGISPREATQMDPQQRMLLELSWEAFEDAGIKPSAMKGTACGVFVGIASFDYAHRLAEDLAAVDAKTPTGNAGSIAANRLSYYYDLRGPSLALDTACSSALVAFHQACVSILAGESEAALVGGVSLHFHPFAYLMFSKTGMLSRGGRCRTFDAGADGYVRSEGGGVLLLKPFSQALADGDRILAIVEGSGTNSDGRTPGITVPSGQAQADLLEQVYEKAGVDPDQLDYLEAHGTGTAVGDPIEVWAIAKALAKRRRKPLLIGSIKSNLGHLEAASGIAGLAKVLLAFQHRVIAPNLHLESPNPQISFDESNVQIVVKPQQLPSDRVIFAGVNSFGFGGSNAHVILSSPPSTAEAKGPSGVVGRFPFIFSARSEPALRQTALSLADFIERHPSLSVYDVALSLLEQREHLSKRAIGWPASRVDFVEALRGFAAGQDDCGILAGEELGLTEKPVFVFTGNGGQWPGMGQELYLGEPTFRAAVDRVDAIFQQQAPFSLLPFFTDGISSDDLERTENTQPLVFAIQVGLVDFLRTLGIEPGAVVGHSLGEVAAAWAAGALDLEDAVRVIRWRSSLQQATQGTGGIVAVSLAREQMEEILNSADLDGIGVTISGENGPNAVTVAGSSEGLAILEAVLVRRLIPLRRLDLPYPFHSPAMDEVAASFKDQARDVVGREAAMPFFSAVTGDLINSSLDAAYWAKNIREPVRFRQAIMASARHGHRLYLEIGPHPVLSSHVQNILAADGERGKVFAPLCRERPGAADVRASAWKLLLGGAPAQWSRYFPHAATARVSLPHYPWQKQEFFVEPTPENHSPIWAHKTHPLLGSRLRAGEAVWEVHLGVETMPWLADHKVGGAVIFPAAAFVEMALAASEDLHPDRVHVLCDFEIHAPLSLDARRTKTLRLSVDERSGGFTISSRERLSTEAWVGHVSGRIPVHAPTLQPCPARQAFDVTGRALEADRHYHLAAGLGLDYGPAFRPIRRIGWDGGSILAELKLPESMSGIAHQFIVNPAILDGALQSLLALYELDSDAVAGRAYVPVRIARLELPRPRSEPVLSCAEPGKIGPRSLLADIRLFDASGALCLRAEGVRFRATQLVKPPAAVGREIVERWISRRRPDSAPDSAERRQILCEQLQVAIEALSESGPLKRYIREGDALLDLLCVSCAYEHLKRLARSDGLLDLEVCGAAGTVSAESKSYVQNLLKMLENDGLALPQDGGRALWQLGGSPEDLPPWTAVWQSLQADFPDRWACTASVGRVALHLSEILAGKMSLEDMRAEDAKQVGREFEGAASVVGVDAQSLIGTCLASLAQDDRLACENILWAAGRHPSISALAKITRASSDTVASVLISPEADPSEIREELSRHQRIKLLEELFAPQVDGMDSSDGAIFDLAFVSPELTEHDLRSVIDRLSPGGLLVSWVPEHSRFADFVGWADAADSGWHHRLDRIIGDASGGVVRLPLLRDVPGAPQLLVAWRPPGPSLSLRANRTLVFPLGEDSAPLSDALLACGCNEEEIRVEKLPPQGGEGSAIWEALLKERSPDRVVLLYPPSGQQGPERNNQAAKNLGILSDCLMACARWLPSAVVVVVTQGAHASNSEGDWLAAGLWGFARVARNELSPLRIRCVDWMMPEGRQDEVQDLWRELLVKRGEDEVRLVSGCRRVRRLMPRVAVDSQDGVDQDVVLDFSSPGLFKNLRWNKVRRPEVGPDEVAIETHATGLNFRDVMYAMGLLPDEILEGGFAGPSLGMELAGVVVAAGANVNSLAVGDEVMAFAPSAFASSVVTPASLVMRKPPDWSFGAAASIPVAFFTAYHSLRVLAELKAGEKLLIHGAAGGVGLAAIQIANHIGAEIFATAGSARKRDFVKLMGAHHVLDSRSLDFADEVRDLSNGQGLDVVLNSLAGEAMLRSLETLRPFGRFIELGKRDFYENTRVGLRPFRHNIRYFGYDADELLALRPREVETTFEELSGLFAEGSLHPLPVTSFHCGNVAAAFRHMQHSGHIGKIVIGMDGCRSLAGPNARQTKARFEKDGTYLISGGLKGFGLETAKWLAAHGAGAVVIINRSGVIDDAAQEFISHSNAQGVRVWALGCDVTDRSAVSALLSRIRRELPPLRGIFHAAVVLQDALIANTRSEQIREVLEPKVMGAGILHELTLNDPLDYFVLYSSATAIFGNPGQSSYVAANAALEALAFHRLGRGLPATCVAWGPIADAGFVARNEELKQSLAARTGGAPIPVALALDYLGAALAQRCSPVAFFEFDWATIARFLPSLQSPCFELLQAAGSSVPATGVSKEDLRSEFAGMEAGELLFALKNLLKEEIAAILHVPASSIDENQSLLEVGMDSLMGFELFSSLESNLGLSLPMMALSESPTVTRLAERLAESINPQEAADEGGNGSRVAQVRQLAAQHGAHNLDDQVIIDIATQDSALVGPELVGSSVEGNPS